MASDDKEYEQSALGKRVNELMDDGYDFGEAVKQAMSEGLKDGGAIGIEVLFGPKRENFIYGGTVFPDGRRGFGGGADMGTVGTDGKQGGKGSNKGLSGGYQGGPKGGYGNTGGGNNNNPPPIQFNKPPIQFNKPPITTTSDDSVNRGFLSDLRKKNQQKYLNLLNKYKPDDFDIMKQMDGTSNLTEEEAKFMERYGAGTIFSDLSKTNIENFFEIDPKGVPPKKDPTSYSGDYKYNFAELNDMQKKMLGGPQKNLKDIMGITNEEILENIKPFDDPDAPATIEDVNKFYAADGGRVGFFMGGPALEGQALNIYNSMNSYGFTDQQIANALQGQGLYTPSGSSTPETTTPNIIGSQINQGGGGDNNFGGQGIGAFGNLDPNTKQTMQVEVADGKGGVEIKEVDTYLDAGGMRKTLDNKNPVNAGIDIKPMAVGIIEALMGKKNDSEFDPAGKIYGTFNNPNYKDLSFFGKIKADYSRQKELKQLQKEFELQEKLKEQIRQEAIANANKPYSGPTFYNTRDDGGRGSAISQDFQNTTASLDNYSADVLRAKGGMVGYKDGGLATMFKEKR